MSREWINSGFRLQDGPPRFERSRRPSRPLVLDRGGFNTTPNINNNRYRLFTGQNRPSQTGQFSNDTGAGGEHQRRERNDHQGRRFNDHLGWRSSDDSQGRDYQERRSNNDQGMGPNYHQRRRHNAHEGGSSNYRNEERSNDHPRRGFNDYQGRERNEHQGRSGRNQGRGPKHGMGFKFLETLLSDENAHKIVLDLSNERSGFVMLLEEKTITDDMFVLLAKCLGRISDSSFYDLKISLLNQVLSSEFIPKLLFYITKLSNQSKQDKDRNKYFWKNTDEFWLNVIRFSKTVQEVLPTNCKAIEGLVSGMSAFLPIFELHHSLHVSDAIKTDTNNLLSIIKDTIKKLEIKKIEKLTRVDKNEEQEPPNDFREIEIMPSITEILTQEPPFLRANIIDRAYRDVDQYLDIQFRLLREDFVAPLRKGITMYLQNQNKPKSERKKVHEIRIYNPIRFISAETVGDTNSFRIQFHFEDKLKPKKKSLSYENSKRFMFGALVCFTSDNFNSLFFGKIVQRDIKILEQGQLIVGFDQDIDITFDVDYVMVESTVYFEPYYQVLGVLQRMRAENFPMEQYLINVQTDLQLPKYLQKPSIVYDIENIRFSPLRFPNRRFFNLNDSQLEAFQAALTEEFSIIQGPPGTGKTYLGLKVAKVLLENKNIWYQKSPMLVICFTNHALDQFLEGLLPVTKNLVRIGGQSKNETLKEYNLIEMRRKRVGKSTHQAIFQVRNTMRTCLERLQKISSTLNDIHSNKSVVNFRSFTGIEDYNKGWFAKASGEEIRKWLLEGKTRNWNTRHTSQVNQEMEALNLHSDDGAVEDEDDYVLSDSDEDQNDIQIDDVFLVQTPIAVQPFLSVDKLQSDLENLKRQIDLLLDEPNTLKNQLDQEKLEEQMWELETDLDYLQRQLMFYENQANQIHPRNVDLVNPFLMPFEDRWLLYYSWLRQYVYQLRQSHETISKEYREQFRLYNSMRDVEDTSLMRDHLVIGMTTTGAARLQSSLQELKCPIVIVEEAAEVLEAHIVAALTQHCQQLILIGDHLQLKPGAASYNIETNYKLGISLFERMVRNNIRCYTLNIQHRMRPEISRLVKPHIYPDLEDHESTLERPFISGIEAPLFFIDHEYPENVCEDASKKNLHEATFLIALARHLILNGYKPEQITILAAYLGQFFEMKREKNKQLNKMILQDVRISVLDNYQGEESDIILLSLVRSNDDNKAGFLRIQNRVCVALSRARNGFYIMGNMGMLLKSNSENQIWDKVNKVLVEQNAIGSHLSLRCQIHRYKVTKVSKSRDFERLSEGGCDMLCEAPLVCGHVCKRLCHIQDRDHNLYMCTETCGKSLCDDPKHLCMKACYLDCGPCTYKVPRLLNCEHEVFIQCSINPDEYKCHVPVLKTLPCGHEREVMCSVDVTLIRCQVPCPIRVEPCGHPCDRKCHVHQDPDHLEYKCKQACAKPKRGCSQIAAPHICSKLCHEECEECHKIVQKRRTCGHMDKIACKLDVEASPCMKPCKNELDCGHKCKNKCSETCGPCKVKVNKILDECRHTVKNIECYRTPTGNECTSRTCPRLLACGHKCKKSCRAPCTTICNEMVDCHILSPCGHLVKRIECHARNSNDNAMLLKSCTEPCTARLKCHAENTNDKTKLHNCTGTCGSCFQGRIHIRCTEKCGVPLVCNHECRIPCREACKPCTEPCNMKCNHSKCNKRCGEPCTPCTAPCDRKCLHVSCKRRCGQICSVNPCTERCQKVLLCGHPCVGFCGDPCPPLCRICNKDELTEIFFGKEDEEDAVFVYLRDCKHVVEHSGMDEWLQQGEDKVQFKTCPKCKTTITTTERYSDYVKMALDDVIEVKKTSYGTTVENEAARKLLLDNINRLETTCNRRLLSVCPKLLDVFGMMTARLQPAKRNRIQPINKLELNAIQSKFTTLSYILDTFKNTQVFRQSEDKSILYLVTLLTVLSRSEDHVTNQEVVDLELEIKRLHRIVQYEEIRRFVVDNHETKLVENMMYAPMRYSDLQDGVIKVALEDLAKKANSGLVISDKERMEIVKAIGLAKGHWYKCPNGHPYAIGECGGAMEIAKCVCGAEIGGQGHRLLPSNQFAGEMDGAQRHAWPGGLH